MGGHDHDARQPDQELLQEGHGRVVEVVGGLVEQDALGPARDECSQRQSHPLTTGHRGHRALPVQVTESEPRRGGLGPVLGVPGVVELGPVEEGGVLVLSRPLVEAQRERLEAGDRLVQRGQGLVEHVADRGPGGERGLLSQVREVGRHGEGSAVGLLLAGEQAQEGRLARAVLTDQAEGLARVGDEVDAVEDDTVAVDADEVPGDERGHGGVELVRHQRHRSR